MDWGKGKWDGAGGNASEGEWQMKLCLGSPAIHLLLCGPVPNGPQTGTGSMAQGLSPVLYDWARRHLFNK